jgi:hypothetical protein
MSALTALPHCMRRCLAAGRAMRVPAAGIVALALVAIANTAAQAQALRAQQRVLVVTQTVTEPAAGVRSTVSARVGALAFTASGLATDRSAETLANATSIVQAAVRDFGTTLSAAQLLALAGSHYGAQSDAIAATLAAALRARGLAQATFVFDQAVRVTGAARTQQLAWTLTVDSSGRASFGQPRLFDAQPTILYAQYVPLRVASGLPQGWAFPGAGQLRWQLLNLQLQPVGAMAILDTAGAFDAPDDITGAAIDPQAGLRCLIDRRARGDCPAGLADIVGLIDQNAAISALLDYGLRLAPVYDPVAGPGGGVEQVARMSMRIDLREVTYGGCTADMTYRNVGQYGFALQSTTDRWQIARDGRFARIDQVQQLSLSPTQSFDGTRVLRPLAVSALTDVLLDPQDPNRPMLRAADIPNLQYLAPITTRGEQEQTVVSFTSPINDVTRLQLDVRCSIAGTWSARSIIAPWAQCRSGGCNSDYYVYEVAFTPGTPTLGPFRWTAVSYRGFSHEGQQVQFDGANTLTFWHNPNGGCSARIGAQFSLAGQFLGVAGFEVCPTGSDP